MRGFTTLKIIIGLFFVIAIIVAVYFFTADKAQSPIQEENQDNVSSTTATATSGDLPAGVSVVEKNGKRVLRDERVGYEMEIPEDLRLKNKDNTILFYSTESDLPVLGGINIFQNDKNLSLEAWVYQLHKEKGFLFYSERKNVKVGEVDAIRIKVEGEIENYEYFIKKDNKIIGLSFPSKSNFNEYLQSFQLD